MDPNAALEEILSYANAILDDESEDYNPDNVGQDAVHLAERVQELHAWIAKGGFLPTAWLNGEVGV